MIYWITLYNKKREAYHYYESILPGIIPDHVLESMRVPGPLCRPDWPQDNGLCEHCTFDTHCHVMEATERGTWRHLCPVLFHDVLKPKWRLEDVP